ncbi:hypothetical protein LZK76_33475 (plasmid) [Rhizobium leguminosarum]|nr:hypothetical protein LZK76_33475 [Rhizobium leguminosarum]
MSGGQPTKNDVGSNAPVAALGNGLVDNRLQHGESLIFSVSSDISLSGILNQGSIRRIGIRISSYDAGLAGERGCDWVEQGLTTIQRQMPVGPSPLARLFALLLKLDFSAQQGGNCFFNRAQPSNKHDVRENVPALSSPFTENQPYWVAFRSESRLLRKIYFFFR